MRFKVVPRTALVSALSLTGLAVSAVQGDQVAVTWMGGIGGWSSASLWSGGVVPNNSVTTTYNVEIDGGKTGNSVVQMTSAYDAPVFSIDSLTIDAGDELMVGSLTIQHSLDVNGTLHSAVGGVELTEGLIDGSGVINFTPWQWGLSRIRSLSSALTIGPAITVVGGSSTLLGWWPGRSTLGDTTRPLVINGSIQSGSPYEQGIILAGSTITNNGTIEVVNGGIVGINSSFSMATIGRLDYRNGSLLVAGTLNNQGQHLLVDNAHGGLILHGRLSGGTLSTGDGKTLRVGESYEAVLDNVYLSAQIVSRGSIAVPAGQQLIGSGDILLQEPEDLWSGGRFYNQSGPTIVSSGFHIHGGTFEQAIYLGGGVGRQENVTINQGTIRADRGRMLAYGYADKKYMLLNSSTTINAGTLEADDLGQLLADGNVTFQSGSRFVLEGRGQLVIKGDLDLSALNDRLVVLPNIIDDGPYNWYPAITYTGNLTGTFNRVTSGIFVSYGNGDKTVRIYGYGMEIPEPASAALLFVCRALGLRRKRRDPSISPCR